MALVPESPPPAPRQHGLMRWLPGSRLVISFSLPPDEAWGRLLGPNRKEWRVARAGRSTPLRYNLRPHADRSTLDIDGPYGDRGPAIRCQVRLIPAGSGTTLELESRHKDNPLWGLLIPLGIMAALVVPQVPLWFSLLALAMLISIWHTAMTLGVHIAAENIQRHVVGLLNDNRPGVLL